MRTPRSLTDQQARLALSMMSSGRTQEQVGDIFGVSAAVIGQLWRGATYRHLSRDTSSSASGPGTYRGRLQTLERRYAREATFWRQVDITVGAGGCWPFTGPRNKDGYGDYSAGKALIGTRSSHVVAYLLAAGLTERPPRGTYVRHLCANRVCCNPAHLAIGTQRDNMADRMAEGNYARGDAHFSTKVPDAVIRALREDYWSTPKKARPKLQALAELHGVEDWGTVWRWLHGKSRREAGGPMGEIATTADMPDALF